METIKFKVRMLSPLWSGDFEGRSRRLRQTSVVGSLRYIGEALLRYFGLYVCPIVYTGKSSGINETVMSKCIHKSSNLMDVCSGCYFWGTTGWQRQFRVYTSGETNTKVANVKDSWLKRVLGKNNNTFEVIEVKDGLVLEFFPLNTYNLLKSDIGIDTSDYIHLLMFCANTFGTLGSKARSGFGFFEIESGLDMNKVKNGFDSIKKSSISTKLRNEKNCANHPDYSRLPNIKNFVRLDFTLKDQKLVQDINLTLYNRNMFRDLNSFIQTEVSGWYIKYYIRKKIKNEKKKRLFELIGDTKKGSSFYASSIYKNGNAYEFRVIIEHPDESVRSEFTEFLEKEVFRDIASLKLKKVM